MKELMIQLKRINLFDLIASIVYTLVIPIILSIIFVFQYSPTYLYLELGLLVAVWVVAIATIIRKLKNYKKNPYPYTYLLKKDTLRKYMDEEEAIANSKESDTGFHYMIYVNDEMHEVKQINYQFSVYEDEADKGSIIYWDDEEFNSIKDIMKEKLSKIEYPVLISLLESESLFLKTYKKDHPDLDEVKYINDILNGK